jgi:hypothetical protein
MFCRQPLRGRTLFRLQEIRRSNRMLSYEPHRSPVQRNREQDWHKTNLAARDASIGPAIPRAERIDILACSTLSGDRHSESHIAADA